LRIEIHEARNWATHEHGFVRLRCWHHMITNLKVEGVVTCETPYYVMAFHRTRVNLTVATRVSCHTQEAHEELFREAV